jgi:hypothetical protein
VKKKKNRLKKKGLRACLANAHSLVQMPVPSKYGKIKLFKLGLCYL